MLDWELEMEMDLMDPDAPKEERSENTFNFFLKY